MVYLIDGYNILFSLLESKSPLEIQRKDLIHYLQDKFTRLKLKGTLVFDGSLKRGEESGLSYKSPLEIVYTHKEQNADSYIVEILEIAKNPKLMTVVTNDKGLTRHARSIHANVITNSAFLKFLEKKSSKARKEKQIKETKHNIDRLLKIFEDRFHFPEDYSKGDK